MLFQFGMEDELFQLRDEIRERLYKPAPCYCFIVNDPVKREVFASHFRDRVVHHLLYNMISPLFERQFIYDSYSCRVGKGTKLGIERLEHHIRSCTRNYTCNAYVLQIDFSGYFMSIPKEKCYQVIMRTISKKAHFPCPSGGTWEDHCDFDLADFLIRQILFRNPVENCDIVGSRTEWIGLPRSKSLLYAEPGTGMPIGDLTSQLFSNIYLNEFDQFVKRELKCRHYGRYVDDAFIVHNSEHYLRSLIPLLKDFALRELGLKIHPHKTRIVKSHHNVVFLGAVVRPYRRYMRTRTVHKFSWAIRQIEHGENPVQRIPTINSYLGYAKHFRSYRILDSRLGNSPLNETLTFKKDYQKAMPRKLK